MLPEWYLISVVAVFGLIIGSFLNVVIYRFHTGKSLNNRSHCLSCGTPLKWYELLPVFSYLALRGRCRSCGSYIPYRYALVELLTAMAFIIVYFKSVTLVELTLLAALLSVLMVGLVYDLYHMIIPDEISLTVAILTVAIFSYDLLLGVGWQSVLAAIVCGLAVFLIFSSLWYFSGGRAFGFGDAKLALPLAALSGWPGAFSFVALSFWIGAIFSILLILWQKVYLHTRKHKAVSVRVNMKSEIPFAPFLILSFVLVYFYNLDVLAFIETIYSRI